MKKTMLWGVLFTLICTQVQAEVTQQPTQPQTPVSISTPVANPPAAVQATPNTLPTQVQPTSPKPAQNAVSTQQIPVVPTQAAPVINCDYKIPASTKTIEQSVILTWSEKAVTQAFDFDPVSVDNQVQKLKACFTDQGWMGFNSALGKSGNVEAIKSQKLTVSSQLDGQAQVTEAKDNQWKLILPLHVVYQNDKEKVTQLLNVNLTVGRKMNGDLGIVQMIATPKAAVTAQQPNNVTAPNAANPTQPSTTNTAAPTTPVNPGTPPAPASKPIQPNGPNTTSNPGTPH